MFTPTTTYKQQDLETLLQNIEIDTKIPQRRGERRETVYGEVTRSVQQVAELQDHVVLQTDSYNNIMLRGLTVDEVLNFYRKVYNYDVQHVVKIPRLFLRMNSEVQATVIHAMMQIYPNQYKSSQRVQDATREELLQAINWYLCPRDCQDFNEKLIDSCKDYKVQHVDEDFSKTSVKLGKLREKFEERYEFLREACILCKMEEAIPNLKWRDGGLLQIFLELTPEETHEGFKTVLTRVSTYTTVDHFLSAYFAVVQDTYEKFDSARILSEERKNSIMETPFPAPPRQMKKMQSFLGAANYFKTFVPLYSQKTALLTDMVHKDFSWNESNWQVDYRKVFEEFKLDLLHAHNAYHPNYQLEWVLCVDASDYAVGGVLFQIPEGAASEAQFQVIAFVSKKLTATARRWSVIEKECFSIFFSVKKLSYYLYGKTFTIRTDHYNLLWMETSEVPKIIRMRIYLQSFNFTLNHIKGKDNVFADWLSRMYNPETAAAVYVGWCLRWFPSIADMLAMVRTCLECSVGRVEESEMANQVMEEVEVKPFSVDEALRQVHNSRVGHHGSLRTWKKLRDVYPGNNVPLGVVEDFVRECPVCQKHRHRMTESLIAPIRKLEPESARHFCGYDTVYVTPATKDGYKYLHHVRLLPARLSALYPAKDLSAESVALALFQFFVTYGISEVLITDPGSNINSSVVKLLLKWMGVRLRMSITNRHQSNFVERTHREVIRFLTDLVHEERVIRIWAEPHVLGIIQFIINDEKSKETGISPFKYVFGTVDAPYFRLPELMEDEVKANAQLSLLDEHLNTIREAAANVQRKRQDRRSSAKPEAGREQYAVGDFVLKRRDMSQFKSGKLSANYFGPYQVVSTYKADVTVKDLLSDAHFVFHMDDLKPFVGGQEKAYARALTDADQFVIEKIVAYKGEPLKRSTTSFLVRFQDGDERWLPYKSVAEAAKLDEFCKDEDSVVSSFVSREGLEIEGIRVEGREGLRWLNLRWCSI